MAIRIKKVPREIQHKLVGLTQFSEDIYPMNVGRGMSPNANNYGNKLEEYEVLFALDELSDAADCYDMKKEADDLKYIVKKFAESVDYEARLKSLINKINLSDDFEKTKNIKKVVVDYYNIRNSFLNKGYSLLYSEQKGYEQVFDYYRKEYESFYKVSQYVENNPVHVAESLISIINIMLQRIKPESRLKSLNKIRDKLKDFDSQELASKKSPGGAAIGVTLSLVKNTLMARNIFFIDTVLKEISARL